jgi:hypothetical protein
VLRKNVISEELYVLAGDSRRKGNGHILLTTLAFQAMKWKMRTNAKLGTGPAITNA